MLTILCILLARRPLTRPCGSEQDDTGSEGMEMITAWRKGDKIPAPARPLQSGASFDVEIPPIPHILRIAVGKSAKMW